jgi:hypothetical protein
MSIKPFTTRGKPGPRWSHSGASVGSPALMAGLPGSSAIVSVGPPLSWRGPSKGSMGLLEGTHEIGGVVAATAGAVTD